MSSFSERICENALPSYSELAEGVKQHYEIIRKYVRKTDESIYSCGWLLDTARCLYTLKYGDVICNTEEGKRALDEKLCPCEDEMRMTLQIRENPFEYPDKAETKAWLCSLGPAVQSFAGVLERELNEIFKADTINTKGGTVK